MRMLLPVFLLAATAAPAQVTSTMQRLHNPLTGQATDIWYNLAPPNVPLLFWNVTPTGDLEVMWAGRSSSAWLLRDPAAFRPANAQVLGIDIADAAYLLDPQTPPTGRIRVINEIECGHFSTTPAVSMPGLPGAFRVAPNAFAGWFGVNPCAGLSSDSLAVYACEWSEVGGPNDVRQLWSYVRLRFQW